MGIEPGLAINELILGQRHQKVMLVDKTSDAPLMERQYVPCPECNALTDARVWEETVPKVIGLDMCVLNAMDGYLVCGI